MPPLLIAWGGLAGRNPRSRPEMTTRKSGRLNVQEPFPCTSSLIWVKKCDDPDETFGADNYLSDTACVPVATSPRPPLAEIRPLRKKVSKTHPIFRPNCLVVSRGILRFPGLLSGGRLPNELRARAPIFLAAARVANGPAETQTCSYGRFLEWFCCGLLIAEFLGRSYTFKILTKVYYS